ncbi:MAG: methyltransferase [Pseudonocardiales bacterium]|nr:methyltransferase [Pseudonocardiales bacterium]
MAEAMLGVASLTFVESWADEDEILTAARARGEDLGCVPIGPAGGATLRFLAAAINARAVVEVGTGAGTSGLWLLRGMRADGVLTTVDIEQEHQKAAREAFTQAGIAPGRFRMINGAAGEVLPRLTDGAYDLVFVDADKIAYSDYYAQAVRLLRKGGIVAFDNTLRSDRVADPSVRDDQTVAIRELVKAVHDDERLVSTLLPVGDGLLVAALA